MAQFTTPMSRNWKLYQNNNQLLSVLYEMENVVQIVKSTRLEWIGHVWRADGRLIKRIISEKMKGTRSRGRPSRRWMDSVREVIMELTQSREVYWNISKNRAEWKNLVSVKKKNIYIYTIISTNNTISVNACLLYFIINSSYCINLKQML